MGAGDVLPIYGCIYRFPFQLMSATTDAHITIASGAASISKDGADFDAAANAVVTITDSAAATSFGYLELTAAEMTADMVVVALSGTGAAVAFKHIHPIRLAVLLTGTAQAGAAGTITLAASGPSASNDEYLGCLVTIDSGTGAGQARVISDYVGSTKVLSVVPNWTTQPDATSVYSVRVNTYQTNLSSLASSVVTTLLADTTVGAAGTATVKDILKYIYSFVGGKIVKSGNAYAFYDDNGSTLLFTLTFTSSQRTRS